MVCHCSRPPTTRLEPMLSPPNPVFGSQPDVQSRHSKLPLLLAMTYLFPSQQSEHEHQTLVCMQSIQFDTCIRFNSRSQANQRTCSSISFFLPLNNPHTAQFSHDFLPRHILAICLYPSHPTPSSTSSSTIITIYPTPNPLLPKKSNNTFLRATPSSPPHFLSPLPHCHPHNRPDSHYRNYPPAARPPISTHVSGLGLGLGIRGRFPLPCPPKKNNNRDLASGSQISALASTNRRYHQTVAFPVSVVDKERDRVEQERGWLLYVGAVVNVSRGTGDSHLLGFRTEPMGFR